jgi:Fe-S cluster biogenesis protein NfuA
MVVHEDLSAHALRKASDYTKVSSDTSQSTAVVLPRPPQLSAKAGTDEEALQHIGAVLDSLRPAIQMDGGDIEFIRYEADIVYVKLSGACVGCPMSMYTLKMGVESALKIQMPSIREVVSID